MNKLQEHLDFLLDKYSVETPVTLDCGKITANGETLPLPAHRGERRFIELKNIVTGGTLCGISVMRTARITNRGADIYAELYREFDICEFVLGRKIKSVTIMENDCVLNAVADAEDGVVCTIEIAATLAEGETPKDKHEIISQRGTACDIAVDVQLKQDSIYLFGAGNEKFTDTDFELFGLNPEDAAAVRTAFALAQNGNFAELKADAEHLEKLISLAKISAQSGEREVL